MGSVHNHVSGSKVSLHLFTFFSHNSPKKIKCSMYCHIKGVKLNIWEENNNCSFCSFTHTNNFNWINLYLVLLQMFPVEPFFN